MKTRILPINYDITDSKVIEKIPTLSDIFNIIDPENKRKYIKETSGNSNNVFFYSINNNKIAIRLSKKPISVIKNFIEIKIDKNTIYFDIDKKSELTVLKDIENKYELSFNELYNIWELWLLRDTKNNFNDNSLLLYYSDEVKSDFDTSLNSTRIWKKYKESSDNYSENDEIIKDFNLKKDLFQYLDIDEVIQSFSKKLKKNKKNESKNKLIEKQALKLKSIEFIENKNNWVRAYNNNLIPKLIYYGSINNNNNIYSCIISEAYDFSLFTFLFWCEKNINNYIQTKNIYAFEDLIVTQYLSLIKNCLFNPEIDLINFDNSLNNLVLKFPETNSLLDLLQIPKEINNNIPKAISKILNKNHLIDPSLIDLKFIDLDSDNFINITELKNFANKNIPQDINWYNDLYFLNLIIMANHVIYYFDRNIFYNFFISEQKELFKRKESIKKLFNDPIIKYYTTANHYFRFLKFEFIKISYPKSFNEIIDILLEYDFLKIDIDNLHNKNITKFEHFLDTKPYKDFLFEFLFKNIFVLNNTLDPTSNFWNIESNSKSIIKAFNIDGKSVLLDKLIEMFTKNNPNIRNLARKHYNGNKSRKRKKQ